jgi:Leucine-rich repeat (LRR) protein
MSHFKFKLFKLIALACLIVLACESASHAQDNQAIEKQKAQIEKEINDISTKTNWTDPDESAKATKRLTDLTNKLTNLSSNQVTGTLKNTDMDVSFKLGDEIKQDFENDEPAKKASGTDSSVFVLCLTNSNIEDFDALDRLYDFPNLEIVYINGYHLNKTLDFTEIINKLTEVHVKELYLVGFSNSLAQIPENIVALSNLKVLGLYGNSLTEVPDFVCSLTNLNEIYFDMNPITKLPEQIGNINKLKLLGLKKTQISSSELSRLKKLLPNCDIQK